MDGVSVCMHRNISSRHPIYKLLRPHFQYLHAINKLVDFDSFKGKKKEQDGLYLLLRFVVFLEVQHVYSSTIVIVID